MQDLTNALGTSVLGVASGFDRIVFQGMLQPLMYEDGAMRFFLRRNILFKDMRDWVLDQTDRLVREVEAFSVRECGQGIEYLRTSRLRKEQIARQRQRAQGIETGLVGTWSCLEAGSTYRIVSGQGAPRLRSVQTRCKHLYVYLDHEDYGFLNLRIQTWFPYRIQIAMNGREWVARQLEKAGVGFERSGNKILRVDDLGVLQELLASQVSTDWPSLLNRFVPVAFPTFDSTLGPGLSYRWTLWQSEWASDLLFETPQELDEIIDSMIRHAFFGAHPDRLLRYFGRRLQKDGTPRRFARDSLRTSVLHRDEGCRIRHWHRRNSVKLYNERNVLRIESTINDPTVFRVHRRKQGADPAEPKQLLPMRKGVADAPLRARVSQEINERFAQHLAATRIDDVAFGSLIEHITRRKRRRGRSIRALHPTGTDLPVLRVVADPRFALAGFTNGELRSALARCPRLAGKNDRQRSRCITRILRLLRDHGLIRRLPRSRRYRLSARGRKILPCLQAALAASTQELTQIAA